MTAPMPDAQSVPPAQPAQTSGLVYADVPNRVIAYIIDAILVGILNFVIAAIVGGMGLSPVVVDSNLNVSVNYAAALILGIIGLLVSAVYFVYTWTSMRATVGMRLLGMQIGNAGDGRTLTMEQAVRRYLALAAPSILAQVFSPLPVIGMVIGLLGILWYVFLLYTTANSPTKQGWHDVFANSQVVKAAKVV